MLSIEHLYCGYGRGDVLRDINLTVERGELFCILGPNGSGKSTLLNCLCGLLAYRGGISLGGRDIKRFSRRAFARKTALLGQAKSIYFPYTVYDTVAMGRYPYGEGILKDLSKEDEAFVEGVLGELELLDDRDRYLDELSGGQLQRVFLGRTLAQDPELILLDEPTNSLDLKHQLELLRYLRRWTCDRGKTVIAVLHDLNLALAFAGRVALLDRGELAVRGRPGELLTGELLRRVYGADIKGFMLESLANWRGEVPEQGLVQGPEGPGTKT
jgi:iron complex transport system ATP-binding protein